MLIMLCAYGWTLSAAFGWTLCVAYGWTLCAAYSYTVPLGCVHGCMLYVTRLVLCAYALHNSPHGTVDTVRVRRFGELSVRSLGRFQHYAHAQTSRGPLPRRGKWGLL